VNDPITKDQLVAEHCWFRVDAVPGQPEMTAFKRRARLGQARWRQSEGLAMGGQLQPGGARTPVGSRLDLEAARVSGANFLSDRIAAAVRHRLAHPEPDEMLNRERLWSDLLSSMPMCFNLFGELWEDRERATVALGTWLTDVPGTVREVRFEWSPGRLEPHYLGNRSAFDAAFVLGLPDGGHGVVGFECKYHEHAKAEKPPGPDRMHRYREVTERSGVFVAGWEAQVVATDLQQLWLDHLLVLSMAQHPSQLWSWVRFVLVHPAGNTSFLDAANRYTAVLADPTTFQVRTVEELVSAPGALPRSLASRFEARYCD
jgi:hypothetical protein